MQELSLEQMKLVSGGVDIPKVTIDGGRGGSWGGIASTSVSFGSYSGPSIGGGGGVGTIVKKGVEIAATVIAEKIVEAVVEKATEKPDPTKAAQEAEAARAQARAAAAEQARQDALERAADEALMRAAEKNHARARASSK
ncbi:hypothetical protein [Pseudoduganella chitinolytica]|uniref:Uncharacterized protein n=1 Tax=Pseudoduganella chitinolytica TaxID=34070 RepID=A0ABY8BFK1_9BURK|nr:hypothetical protein [Pseudoduganella chitinolytica]WEF34697.1 hypothetical protein PX653_08035 [Pseudoduganella chitinolytica]